MFLPLWSNHPGLLTLHFLHARRRVEFLTHPHPIINNGPKEAGLQAELQAGKQMDSQIGRNRTDGQTRWIDFVRMRSKLSESETPLNKQTEIYICIQCMQHLAYVRQYPGILDSETQVIFPALHFKCIVQSIMIIHINLKVQDVTLPLIHPSIHMVLILSEFVEL